MDNKFCCTRTCVLGIGLNQEKRGLCPFLHASVLCIFPTYVAQKKIGLAFALVLEKRGEFAVLVSIILADDLHRTRISLYISLSLRRKDLTTNHGYWTTNDRVKVVGRLSSWPNKGCCTTNYNDQPWLVVMLCRTAFVWHANENAAFCAWYTWWWCFHANAFIYSHIEVLLLLREKNKGKPPSLLKPKNTI